MAGLLATGLLVALAAAGTAKLLPQTLSAGIGQVGLAGSFGTTGIDLGSAGLTIVMVAMFASYVVTVRAANRLSPLLVLGAIAALHALMLLAPPLFSTDVFSYQFYGRIGALYAANPYLSGPLALHLDPLYPYIGTKWIYPPTVYGPLFTALSYVLAPLSIPANVLAYKAIAAVSSLAVVALVWNGARLRGIDPVRAAALVGLNPLIVVYGVGGGHNDLLMLVPLLAGIVLLLQRRERLGAGSIVVAAAIKVTAGLLLPFALAGARGAGGPLYLDSPARPADRGRRGRRRAERLCLRHVRRRTAAPPGDDRDRAGQGQLAEHPRVHRDPSRARHGRPFRRH